MEKSSVCAIVPVYNVEEYLEQCLDSLAMQETPFDEIILINDGSTDNSLQICQSYKERFSNFVLVNQENQGLAAARNTGLRHSRADYIVFIDSDDYVSLRLVSAVKEKLKTCRVDVLYYSADVVFDFKVNMNQNEYHRKALQNEGIMSGIEYFEQVFPNYYIVSACMAAYKREFLNTHKIVFPHGMYFEDNFFSLQVILNADKTTVLPDSLYIRRYRENSIMTGAMSEIKYRDLVKTQELMVSYIYEKDFLNENVLLAQKFAIYQTAMMINRLGMCNNDNFVREQKKKLIEKFFEKWDVINKNIDADSFDSTGLLVILYQIRKEMESGEYDNLIHKYWLDKSCFIEYYDSLFAENRQYIVNMLIKIPLGKKTEKIGIYGIGKHTDALLKLYRHFIGSIECELYFIITSGDTKKTFMDRQVFLYNHLPQDSTQFVISSKVYQEEMKAALLQQGICEEHICLLYDERDIYDITAVSESLLNG